MKIISWNVNGIRAMAKKGLFSPIFTGSPDFVCLQETKAEPAQLPEEVKNIPGYHSYFSHPKVKKGYSGVAVYTKEEPKEVFYGLGIEKLDDEGRMIGLKFKNFTLINLYFPNGGGGPERLAYKLEFYQEFLKFIKNLRAKGEHIIFCGDINTAHHEMDLARPKQNVTHTGFLPIERAWIDKVVESDFIDIFRKRYPEEITYTYWDQKTFSRDRNIGWRIDYFFISKELEKKTKDTGMLTNFFGSDHCPIWLEMLN